NFTAAPYEEPWTVNPQQSKAWQGWFDLLAPSPSVLLDHIRHGSVGTCNLLADTKWGAVRNTPRASERKKKIHCDPKFPWRASNRQTYLRCWRSAGAAQWPSSSPLVCPTCQPKAPHMCSCGMAGHGVSQAPEFQGACSHPATVQRESRAAFVRS